ncbi:MAG: hypothetical protein Fur005_31330 [Roseiflexaceae bacterium]
MRDARNVRDVQNPPLDTAANFDVWLQRYGEALIRLCVLLSPTAALAEAACVRAAGRLQALVAANPTDDQILPALDLIVPPARRAQRKLPAWASSIDPRSPDGRLLQRFARLPAEQRIALTLPIVLPLANDDLLDQHNDARRLALLALAPAADLPDLPAILADQSAPEECQTARRALIESNQQLRHDPRIRGHLALCDACRSAAQQSATLTQRVEDLLRILLRPIQLSDALRQQLIQIANPPPPQQHLSSQIRRWLPRAAIPLIVVGLIAALIWPREQPLPSSPVQTGAAVSGDLQGLVQAAAQNLYSAPASGTWQLRYQLRWSFADGSYAPLIGEIVRDSDQNRLRMNLTHAAGGGPYEYALADGRRNFWYAVTRSYADVVQPYSFDPQALQIHRTMSPSEQRAAFEGRLNSGAWSLPTSYLNQASSATLQSWGRQRSSNGENLEVVGFRGVSGLIGSSDLPGGPNDTITILLSINPATRQLYEIRELIGPSGGEQVSRTIWQRIDQQQLTDRGAIDRAFNLSISYGGTATFPNQASEAGDPLLPLVNPDRLISPVLGLEAPGSLPIAFPREPHGAIRAALVRSALPNQEQSLVLIYLAGTRQLVIWGQPDSNQAQAEFRTDGPIEQLALANRPALVRRDAADRYAVLIRPAEDQDRPILLTIQAVGYSRDELLAVLNSLEPISPTIISNQLDLFSNQAPSAATAQARPLILAALAAEQPQLSPDLIQNRTSQRFVRQNPADDSLNDPYHYPPYGNTPELLREQQWIGSATMPQQLLLSNGDTITFSGETAQQIIQWTTSDGRVVEQQIIGSTGLSHDIIARRLLRLQPLTAQTNTRSISALLLRMLICGGQVTPSGNGQTSNQSMISLIEPDWHVQSCLRPHYPRLFEAQQAPRWADARRIHPEDGPFVADLSDQPIVTTIWIDQNGRAIRSETRTNGEQQVVIESWERLSEQNTPIGALNLEPIPEPLFELNASEQIPSAVVFRTTTLSETLSRFQHPLLAPAIESRWYSAIAARFNGQQTRSLAPVGNPDWPFDDALWRGLAIQCEVSITTNTGGVETVTTGLIYQGPAQPFAELLRTRAIWRGSSPTTLTIAGTQATGWVVETERGTMVIAEYQDILIAFPDTAALRTIVAEMQLVTP